jgi:ribonucleoside-diphosphate reductase alpha chain
MSKKVIKRDGSKADWDINKIRKQINPACEGTDINPLEFESLIDLDSSHNVKSSDIQEKLILISKNNVSDENPDWDIVSGRCMSHQLQREVWKNTKFDMNQFEDHLDFLIRNGYYRKDIKDNYSKQDMQIIQDKVTKQSPDTDYNLRLSQIALLKSKYLLKNKKGTIEYPSTADMANSMILASIEEESKRAIISVEYYEMLSKYLLSLATPFKANLRIPDGNTGSCFIGSMPDNTSGIFKSYWDMARISQEGGGIGWYVGKVRPGDAYSYRVPKANAITKWVKIVNDIAVAVNQRGIRNGAITPAIDWWHLDCEVFTEIKSELNGDLRDKCFDIFPQVVVDNYFLRKVKAKEEVYQYDQYEFKQLTGIDITELIGEKIEEAHKLAEELILSGKLKHYHKIKAGALWGKMLKAWIEYGDFYICNKDNINISNYISEFGIAHCVNLCTESWSIVKEGTRSIIEIIDGKSYTRETDSLYHSCNLISINVANILNDDILLERVCANAVRMLDASIDLGTMPVLEAKNSAELLRNIGIGVVGMADYMAWNKALYDTEEGRLVGEKLIEKIAYYCYNASIDLAIEKGSYPGIVYAKYDKLFGKDPQELNRISPNGFDWVRVQQRILKHGIRNFLILAIAPNTSSGLVQGVTASYLPAHSKNNTQKLNGLIVPVLPKFIKERFWFYKTKFQYKTEDIIKFTRSIQRWVDTGVSMELTINPDLSPSIKSISDAIIDGMLSEELKAVYYSLTISGADDPSYKCDGCSN